MAATRQALLRVPYQEPPPPRSGARAEQLFGAALSPEEAVDRIIRDVASKGDTAVLDYTRRIDGVDLPSLFVPPEALQSAKAKLEVGLLRALESAAERVRRFHE
ncbi:MAG: hisD, partial [Dehalococcoidia bacterium]|nr:hisD [Dehalococcoidia bacterium]